MSLGVLAASLVRHDSAMVLAMAIGALGLVIARMWLTFREVRQSATNYQDARTDSLTGLSNRRAFLERLQSCLFPAQGAPEQAGVLLVDLDGFKEVNDALGHAAGDELLMHRGQAVRAQARVKGASSPASAVTSTPSPARWT